MARFGSRRLRCGRVDSHQNRLDTRLLVCNNGGMDCDNCLREIEVGFRYTPDSTPQHESVVGVWVHTRTGGPECHLDDGRLDLGAVATPDSDAFSTESLRFYPEPLPGSSSDRWNKLYLGP